MLPGPFFNHQPRTYQWGKPVKSVHFQSRQRGAVIVTVAMMLLFLLGFTGIAIDFGRLFIVKTELQTAMDSCALAAAQELDGSSTALARATAAGRTAGNMNNFNFQSSSVALADVDVEFNDTLEGEYSRTIPAADAKYVQCRQQKAGIAPWLLQALTAFSGNPGYATSNAVAAAGTATLASAQTNCMVPVGVCPVTSAAPWGFQRGDWLEGVTTTSGTLESGQFRWLEFPSEGPGGTSQIKNLLAGTDQCNLPGTNTPIEDIGGKAGKATGAILAWNTRFGLGIERGNTETLPDLTGYAWYHNGPSSTLPDSMKGRYDDTSTRGFAHQRSINSAFQSNPNNADQGGLDVTRKRNDPIPDHTLGANRRVVTVGVLDGCSPDTPVKLNGFACMLMLHPMDMNSSPRQPPRMWLEFISDASAPTNNPCATLGLPGGSGGPRVPTLVR